MNLFHRYTRRTLRKNPTRTLVTVIGIVLSMALFTAVLEGAASGLSFLVRSVEESVGSFYGYFPVLSREEAEGLREEKEIDGIALWEEVGWAGIGGDNEWKPYLLIKSMGEDPEGLLSLRLTEGRMPENENEILLPKHLESAGGITIPVGETLTLEVGRRRANGLPLGESDFLTDENETGYPEAIEEKVTKTYLVTGKYERFDHLVEPFQCPGYFALTRGAGNGSFGAFFRTKSVGNYFAFSEGLMRSLSRGEELRTNDELLRYKGGVRGDGLRATLYGFAAILCALIAFGSISLIYNSFAISVSERTREYGVLKSVGATKKQIASSVLYEAGLLAAIGIPLGLLLGLGGIGITLSSLDGIFSRMLSEGSEVRMRLAFHLPSVLIAAAVCLLTTLLSAWVPARRAMRVSPMEAIRATSDVRIRAREVHTSPLTRKLFGFEGVMASKNFKRNRRRYRATVLSLFLSVVLFISASSFTAYLTDAVVGMAKKEPASDLTVLAPQEGEGEILPLLPRFRELSGVKKVSYTESVLIEATIQRADLSADYGVGQETAENKRSTDVTEGVELVFLEDAEFRELLGSLGEKEEAYFDQNAPRGLLYNWVANRFWTEEGSHWVSYSLVNPGKLPVTLREYKVIPPPGTVDCGIESDARTGESFYCFLPEEEYERLQEGGEFDESKVLRFSREEVTTFREYTAARVVADPLIAFKPGRPELIYPLSLKDAVWELSPEDGEDGGLSRRADFLSSDHQRIEKELMKIAEEGDVSFAVHNLADRRDTTRLLITVVKVFSYGFIILISLIAVANVFNSVSTGILLRRREFAMMRAIGLSEKGFRKMMRFECLLYGLKSLLWGLPASFAATFLIWRVTTNSLSIRFFIPWESVLIAAGSVFAVVFATMLYASHRLRKDNLIDAIKNETL